MQPPPLAVIAHGKLSFQMYFKFSRRSLISNLFSRYATPSARPFQPAHLLRFLLRSPGGWCVSLLFEANETRAPRLRNFDTEPHSPYCYEGYSDNRLESVATRTPPPICTSTPFLKPRWSKSRGRRERS
jgi:hypothetical protein